MLRAPIIQGDHKQQKDQRKTGKELRNLERKIARLDAEKREFNDQLLTETAPDEALRLHEQVQAIEVELSDAEEKWMELSDFE